MLKTINCLTCYPQKISADYISSNSQNHQLFCVAECYVVKDSREHSIPPHPPPQRNSMIQWKNNINPMQWKNDITPNFIDLCHSSTRSKQHKSDIAYSNLKIGPIYHFLLFHLQLSSDFGDFDGALLWDNGVGQSHLPEQHVCSTATKKKHFF